MNDTKSPLVSVGIMGPAISIIVLLLNQWKPGLGITGDDVSGVINDALALVAAATAIYGRWRATKQITLTK